MPYSHTMQCCSGIKKSGAAMWVNLENIMLRERIELQNTTYTVSFKLNVQNREIQRQKVD